VRRPRFDEFLGVKGLAGLVVLDRVPIATDQLHQSVQKDLRDPVADVVVRVIQMLLQLRDNLRGQIVHIVEGAFENFRITVQNHNFAQLIAGYLWEKDIGEYLDS